MYKVLVVDDEPLISRSIQQLVKKAHGSFQVIGAAYNGAEALEKAALLMPDLVLTDVKMPVMNGIELAMALHEKYPTMRIIMLSGYDDFAYVKAAFKANVADYLLKPITKAALAEVLERLEAELDLERRNTQQLLLKQLLCGKQSAAPDANMRAYFEQSQYLICLCCSGGTLYVPATPVRKAYEAAAWERLQTEAKNTLLYNPFWFVEGSDFNQQFLVISCNPSEARPLAQLTQELWATVSPHRNRFTFLLHSDTFSLEQLPKVAKQLEHALPHALIFGTASFTTFKTDRPSRADTSLIPSAEQLQFIVSLVETSRTGELRRYLATLLQSFEEKRASQDTVMRSLNKIIRAAANARAGAAPEPSMEPLLQELSAWDGSYHKLEELLYTSLLSLLPTQAEAKQNTSLPSLPERVDAYLVKNYASAINLQTVADHFRLSAPYLSKLYYQHYQATVKNRLLELRIQKSQEMLLLQPPLPLSEIAVQTGFNDQFYFSKVFKRFVHMSPSEYRKAIQSQSEESRKTEQEEML